MIILRENGKILVLTLKNKVDFDRLVGKNNQGE